MREISERQPARLQPGPPGRGVDIIRLAIVSLCAKTIPTDEAMMPIENAFPIKYGNTLSR
jgi:hypothetical protein